MRGAGIVCRLSVMDVTAEGAEGAEDSPTVHVPSLVQSSASSATSAVKSLAVDLNAGPTTMRRPAHQSQPSS